MIKSQRIQEMNKYIVAHKTVSLDRLMEVFQVSKNTIRRDVQELIQLGTVKKIYGGVSALTSELVPFHERAVKNQPQKQLIAEKAAQFVQNNDIIFLDSGTTTIEMIPFLKDLKVTVITNNIHILMDAMVYDNLTIYSTGGMLERKTNSLVGLGGKDILKEYNINKAFLAATGITIQNGATNSSSLETGLKSIAVEKSRENFLLVDDSKFGKSSLTTYASLSAIQHIITNQRPSQEYLDFTTEKNIDLYYPN